MLKDGTIKVQDLSPSVPVKSRPEDEDAASCGFPFYTKLVSELDITSQSRQSKLDGLAAVLSKPL